MENNRYLILTKDSVAIGIDEVYGATPQEAIDKARAEWATTAEAIGEGDSSDTVILGYANESGDDRGMGHIFIKVTDGVAAEFKGLGTDYLRGV